MKLKSDLLWQAGCIFLFILIVTPVHAQQGANLTSLSNEQCMEPYEDRNGSNANVVNVGGCSGKSSLGALANAAYMTSRISDDGTGSAFWYMQMCEELGCTPTVQSNRVLGAGGVVYNNRPGEFECYELSSLGLLKKQLTRAECEEANGGPLVGGCRANLESWATEITITCT